MAAERFLERLAAKFRSPGASGTVEALHGKYRAFRRLIAADNAALEAIADMQEKASGDFLFDMKYVRDAAAGALRNGADVVHALRDLSERDARKLEQAFDSLNLEVDALLSGRRVPIDAPPVISLSGFKDYPLEAVGGKNRRLSEILFATPVPVPDGFALTETACREFLEKNGLVQFIGLRTEGLPLRDRTLVRQTSKALQEAVAAASWPCALEEAVLGAYDALGRRLKRDNPLVSVRSSAVGEDGAFSFAGQFATVLNVGREGLLDACRNVMASQFGTRAVVYCITHGFDPAFLPMSVGVIAMIDARAGGVLYTQSPSHPGQPFMFLTAGWGLGASAVEGRTVPDEFVVSREGGHRVEFSRISPKKTMLLCREGRGLVETAVPEWMQVQPSLTRDQISTLAAYGMQLEELFGGPQDVEWALSADGNIVVLQSRPLRVGAPEAEEPPELVALRRTLKPLLDKGLIASRGAASGPVHVLRSEEDAALAPDGAVLVSVSASPVFSTALARAAALITEAGSPASHLATVARETGVPALVAVEGAVAALEKAGTVTVDARMGYVYPGRVEALTTASDARSRLSTQAPLFRTLNAVLERLAPLGLTDPRSRQFRASSCRSLHDVLRFAHETAVQSMFSAGEVSLKGAGKALKLASSLPLPFYFIDLGGGLAAVEGMGDLTPAEFRCRPLKALWKGMAGTAWDTGAAAGAGGMASAVSTTLASGSLTAGLAEPNYVIVSDIYLNMNFRMGYHFSRVDALLSERTNETFASLLFHGGAANATGRARRLDFLEAVLGGRQWRTARRRDAFTARLELVPPARMEEELVILGRLLVATRQIDTLLRSDDDTRRAVEAFRSELATAAVREGEKEQST